ncbi:MAG: hypothetical protein ACP6IT_04815 [Candidatus Thorarchaeota archaeon]
MSMGVCRLKAGNVLLAVAILVLVIMILYGIVVPGPAALGS